MSACEVPGCDVEPRSPSVRGAGIPGGRPNPFCPRHWAMLPEWHRRAVKLEWSPGFPKPAYVDAVRKAVDAIEGRRARRVVPGNGQLRLEL